MKIEVLKRFRGCSNPVRRVAGAALGAVLLSAACLQAAPVVETISGGPSVLNPQFYGFVDGDTENLAQFHTPWALALDSSGTQMFVADRDNNAIRQIYLQDNVTTTFAAGGLINKPVGVQVDGEGNVYVLSQSNNFDGTVLKFDQFATLLEIKNYGIANAWGMTMDINTNLYLTVKNNEIRKITPDNVITTLATITNAGATLRGIAFLDNGLLAVTDSGRHGILLVNPNNGSYTNLTGFNGVGDAIGSKAVAKFRQPIGIAAAGNDFLIVTDWGNHHVKVVNPITGTVTNLYGVKSNFWYTGAGSYPGWWDGTVCTVDNFGCPESRSPAGVVFAPDGSVYTSETYYHLIRKTSGAGLPLPPPPPTPVAAPQIGWVNLEEDTFGAFRTRLHPGSSFIFNNDVPIAILSEDGTETHYTFGSSTVESPSSTVGSTPPSYEDGGFSLPTSLIPPQPDVTIKAVSFQAGRPDSAVVKTRFQFKTGSPLIIGNNPASFAVSNETSNAEMWYTTDGTAPIRSAPSIRLTGNTVSVNGDTNFTFKVRGFRDGYQDSEVVSKFFSSTNFLPVRITFGLTNGEPSSTFIARPGQFYYSPVTLQLPPEGETMFSLQFNVGVTNGLNNPNTGVRPPAIVNAAGVDFFSMLMAAVPTSRDPDHNPPPQFEWYKTILPYLFTDNSTTNASTFSMFTNFNNNIIGVGWIFRPLFDYTIKDPISGHYYFSFSTLQQDLISFSIAHDTLFKKAGKVVILGAYSFQVPDNASQGDKYFIQLGSPSATRDGVGAPGASVYIRPPATPTAVTVGSPSYIVGDVAPFRWLNAGDFGEGTLLNDDVQQVFQTAVLGLDAPPGNSDLFTAMDSCGRLGVSTNDYFIAGGFSGGNIFDGNDTVINDIAFGDGVLDVTDVFVTFRRSLDPSLTWYRRFWTNGQLVAVTTTNLAFNSNTPSATLSGMASGGSMTAMASPGAENSSVVFTAGDVMGAAGQTIQVPITAKIFGSYPLRTLALNVAVRPVGDAPPLTQAIQFSQTAPLGNPTLVAPSSRPNIYSAVWLNSSIAGLSGSVQLGMLTIKIPANASASAVYAIRFDHASASPNGVGSFAKQTKTGLVMLSSHENSSWGDGISDTWRLRYFGGLDNVLSAPTADADGDGANNAHEFAAGTDPNDSSSVLKAKSRKGQAQECVIRWPSVSGKQYAIERSATMAAGSWSALTTVVGTGGDMEYTDSAAIAGPRFYRVRVQ